MPAMPAMPDMSAPSGLFPHAELAVVLLVINDWVLKPHLAGWVPVPLAQAVPSVAGWRLGSLPRALEREQVQRLLGFRGEGVDVTYLADTVVLLRFFEAVGRVRRAMSIEIPTNSA